MLRLQEWDYLLSADAVGDNIDLPSRASINIEDRDHAWSIGSLKDGISHCVDPLKVPRDRHRLLGCVEASCLRVPIIVPCLPQQP